MSWKIFLVTFSSILVAEFADKTQLVGIGLSAKTGKPLIVWLGSVTAYAIITAITVIVGAMLSKYVKAEVIRYAGAIVFITLGILMFFEKI